MRNTSRPSVRSLLLTAALAFALGASAAAQEQKPPDKPPQIAEPEQPEEKPAPRKEAPPAEKTGEEQPAETAPPEAEAPPEEKPAKEVKPQQKPATEAKPGEEAVSPEEEAVNAAIEMSKRLAELKSFNVKATLAWEEVLENGEKILSLEQVKADLSRPHGLRMERTSPGRERVLFYNGEQVVLWGPVTRYYAVAPFTGTLAELVTHLADKYGYEIPLADLFMWGHDEEQIKAITSANFVGQDLVGGRVCDHYAYRQEGADWQLWIDTGGGGLPCGYAIIDLSDPARPLFLATIEINSDAAFYDERFTFAKPKDAAEIPLATTRLLKDGAAPEEGDATGTEDAPKEEKAAPEEESAPGKGEPGTPDTDGLKGKSPKEEE